MEPIAKRVAARGHEVHIVAPWHPRITRGKVEDGVLFHFFHYAPVPALNVFGYAAGLRADVQLKRAAWMAAPLAHDGGLVQGAARRAEAARHGDARALGGPGRRHRRGRARPALPLVVSLHGSDVFVAERTRRRGAAARQASSTRRLRDRVQRRPRDAARSRSAPTPIGIEVVPYGVDAARFTPDAGARATRARAAGHRADAPLRASPPDAWCARRASST